MTVPGDSSSSDAAATTPGNRAPSSLPPPAPKSPPNYPDLYGKRREAARIQMLDREIGLLQEDLKFVEGLHPASLYCKEVVDFVVAAADPLTPTTNKKDRTSCRVWKWLCKLPCLSLPWLCCYHCSLSFHIPKCWGCCKPRNCTLPKCNGRCLCCCFRKSSCSADCFHFSCPWSCSHSLCTEWSCSVPKCAPRVRCRCNCIKNCCNLRYSCCP